MKHTPGPWEKDGNSIRTERGCIAVTPTPQNGGVFDREANAYLIASAPDLLEACKALVSAMTQLGKEHHREVAQAQAAIAKAESAGLVAQ